MFLRLRFLAASLVILSLISVPAFAESKDMIQLQTQIQQLMDAVARLQQANDERMGVMKDLVQQTADSVNKMSVVVDGLKLQMQNSQDASAAKNDQLSGQIQSLNDSLDEMKARLARMEKSLGDVQNQQQSTNAMLSNLPQPGTNQPGASQGGTNQPGANQPGAPLTIPDQPATGSRYVAPSSNAAPATLPPPAAGPSAGDLYRAALGDYMGAKTALSTSEFNELIKSYPDDNLSGNAYFYLGEMNYKNQKLTVAVKDYDALLERYPDNVKIPTAHLHKAFALIAMKQNDAGVRELRALIQRFPNSPEASQARTKLSSLHIAGASRE
jgi:TolA-binding protein